MHLKEMWFTLNWEPVRGLLVWKEDHIAYTQFQAAVKTLIQKAKEKADFKEIPVREREFPQMYTGNRQFLYSF